MSQSFAQGAMDSLKKGDVKAALRRYDAFKKHADGYQRLHKQLHGTEDSIIAKIYEELDLVCQFGSGKITENQLGFRMNQLNEKYKPPSEKEEEELKKQIRKEFLELGTQIQVIGQDPDEFVASKMIDTYRIARDRLDDGEKILRLIYVDNPGAPEFVRGIFERLVKGEISKEDAAKQLTERENAVKKYLGEMKIKATGSKESAAVVSPFAPYVVSIADRNPAIVFHKQLTSEDRLKADIIAESMDETGEVDKENYF